MHIEALIYFKVTDNAFKRAANTVTVASQFTRLMKEVTTKQDFLDAWQAICGATSQTSKIRRLHLFTHASKGDEQDGLEFKSFDGQSGTLTFDEMLELPKVPWSPNADEQLILYGCNTGLRGARGWCPAEHLAQTQRVKTVGETGYSYFSKNQSDYEEQAATDQNIYLHAYNRGKNGALGNGNLIPAESHVPYLADSVGDGGANATADVEFVQSSLNEVPSGEGGVSSALAVDGLVGTATIGAINTFQQQQFGFQDGRVDPDGKTLTKLVTYRQ